MNKRGNVYRVYVNVVYTENTRVSICIWKRQAVEQIASSSSSRSRVRAACRSTRRAIAGAKYRRDKHGQLACHANAVWARSLSPSLSVVLMCGYICKRPLVHARTRTMTIDDDVEVFGIWIGLELDRESQCQISSRTLMVIHSTRTVIAIKSQRVFYPRKKKLYANTNYYQFRFQQKFINSDFSKLRKKIHPASAKCRKDLQFFSRLDSRQFYTHTDFQLEIKHVSVLKIKIFKIKTCRNWPRCLSKIAS